MKRPAASTRQKGVPKTGKSTREVKDPKAPKGKAKAKAKPGRKAQVTPKSQEAATSEAIPKTTGRKRKAEAEAEATSIKPKTSPSTSKRSKTTHAKENSNAPAVKATFARRWPPKVEPSLSFHNALRAAFERSPGKGEDTIQARGHPCFMCLYSLTVRFIHLFKYLFITGWTMHRRTRSGNSALNDGMLTCQLVSWQLLRLCGRMRSSKSLKLSRNVTYTIWKPNMFHQIVKTLAFEFFKQIGKASSVCCLGKVSPEETD
jgi:hypothetical protein